MLLVVAESSGSSPGRAGYKMAVAADGDVTLTIDALSSPMLTLTVASSSLTVTAAGATNERTGAPIWLHPDDRMLWDVVWPDRAPDARPPVTRLAASSVSAAGVQGPAQEECGNAACESRAIIGA